MVNNFFTKINVLDNCDKMPHEVANILRDDLLEILSELGEYK